MWKIGVKVGECVAVFVPEFDRGKGDPPNVIGVVLEIENKRFKIGTKAGIIKNWLGRNSFESVKYKGLKKEQVPSESLSLREIVKKLSVGNGQGYVRCFCKGLCQNKKFKCFKSKYAM